MTSDVRLHPAFDKIFPYGFKPETKCGERTKPGRWDYKSGKSRIWSMETRSFSRDTKQWKKVCASRYKPNLWTSKVSQ